MNTAGASQSDYDVVIVGGGHNGLTAAAYLAGAGLSVLVLERLGRTGGAAVSTQAFPGLDARLSRYSYLVSLMPQQLMGDLELDLELRSRGAASYSPVVRNDRHLGLYIERDEGEVTRRSFHDLTGGDAEYEAWQTFFGEVADLARVVGPTLMDPLPTAGRLQAQLETTHAARERGGTGIWNAVVERPLGEVIEERFSDDLVRGVVATDALIGTFADLHDPTLIQNRCFLYHLIGNGTGGWKVPVGGMGAVTTALHRSAQRRGAEIRTGAEVTAIRANAAAPGGANTSARGAEVSWRDGQQTRTVSAGTVLAGVAPYVLNQLLGRQPEPDTKPTGSQLKINFLLSRLPTLRSGHDPARAFGGTFHVAEEYSALARSFGEAAAGSIPSSPPGEFYCHSLTDPSILGGLAAEGVHTLTYFGLHMPGALFSADRVTAREEAVRRAIAAVDVHLNEPLMDCVLVGPDGKPCIEAKVAQDVEADLAMPGGHIFHGDLAWPWAADDEALDTPAQRWGVDTDDESVLLCGSGARRGGAVSGLGGHNAAMAVLAAR